MIKGSHLSIEQRKHISEGMRGHKYGPRSEEHRKHLSEALKGRIISKQTRKLMSVAHMGHIITEETKRKMRESNLGKHRPESMKQKVRGKNHPHWNGGIRHHDGYIRILKPDYSPCPKRRYLFEHRLIVEKLIGRHLKASEPVHHLNRKRADNRPQNLIAFVGNDAHKRFENSKPMKPGEILFDGRLLKH